MSSRAGYRRARANRLRDCGLCFVCGQRPAWKPDGTCVECRDKARAKAKQHNAKLREHETSETARRVEFKRTHPARPCCRCARTFQPTASRRITCNPCWRGDHEVSAAISDRWAN